MCYEECDIKSVLSRVCLFITNVKGTFIRVSESEEAFIRVSESGEASTRR